MNFLLAAALATPIGMLLACIHAPARARMIGLLAFAPVPAAFAALLASGGPALVFDQPLVRLTLVLDRPGAMLFGVSAVLWIAAGAYVPVYLKGRPNCGRFAVFWLLTLAGSLGVFVATDLASFYLAFTLVSLAAYGLVIHDDTPATWRAGGIYVTLAVLGETLLLMGFVLLAAATPGDRHLIADAVAALPASPWYHATMALLIAGFALKAGLVPMHVWMPLTYTSAPIPAAAVLSGAVVKAGVIGLIRFLPFDTGQPGWGGVLVAFGLFSAFYGVAVGITQSNPKTVLAYSSISQMGVIATVLGMALRAGDAPATTAVAFYAANHVLIKGGLFLAIGVAAATGARQSRLPKILLPAALLALSLAGLPFTGGALAKLAVKLPLGDGFVATATALSAAGTTLLMLHFLYRLRQTASPAANAIAPTGMVVCWLATALAAMAIPFGLYWHSLDGGFADAFSPAGIVSGLWPVGLGAILALGLYRWGNRLPLLPSGDIVVAAETALCKASIAAAAVARADLTLRQWPIAGLSLLVIAIVLGAAMLWRV